ncbi:MAG TPA: cupin domain-containing protein [Polyangiaceae bacterium]|nr:cupin domain-containing protein [Polyangiaceae bacterium]
MSSKHISKNALERTSSAQSIAHPLNPRAKRKTLSLGDETGLRKCAVHLNVVAPGDETTESHVHECVDEFIYIISGKGTVYLDDTAHEVSSGDFIGFPARGPAHWMKNTGTTDLVYLVGGDRAEHDVCDYPHLEKRVYVTQVPDGRRLDFVDIKNVNSVRRP